MTYARYVIYVKNAIYDRFYAYVIWHIQLVCIFIWVSKEASVHQDNSLIPQELYNFCLNVEKWVFVIIFNFLCIFKNFLCKKYDASGRSSLAPRELNFFLVSYMTYWNGKILWANSNSKILYFWPPLVIMPSVFIF